MVLKEANQMISQINEIRQFLCENYIETVSREVTFGKYIDGLEMSQLPNLGNGLERGQSNDFTD